MTIDYVHFLWGKNLPSEMNINLNRENFKFSGTQRDFAGFGNLDLELVILRVRTSRLDQTSLFFSILDREI